MKICEKCGAQLDDNAAFCGVCGASSDPKPVLPDQPFQFSQPQFYQPQQLNQPPQFDQQPQFYQTPKFDQAPQLNNPTQFSQPQFAPQGAAPYNAPVQKGSSKKLIIIIAAVVAVIAITILVLFLFVFKSKNDLIIGTWQEVKENGRGSYTRFNKDGTMEYDLNSSLKATYKIDGKNLIVSIDSLSESYEIVKLTDDEMVLTRRINGKDIEVKFKKLSEDDEKNVADEYVLESKLKTANANAKLVFVTVNNKVADLVADGEHVDDIKTDGAVSVESLKDSNNPVLKAVYDALKDNGEGLGYVYIEYYVDDDGVADHFAQWSETEDGALLGQFPNPPKYVANARNGTFGKKIPKSTSDELMY